MTQHQSFQNTKQKFRRTWEQSDDNKQKIKKDIRKIRPFYNSATYTKSFVKLPVLDNILLNYNFSGTKYEITFENFPDWAIHDSNFQAYFYLNDGYDVSVTADNSSEANTDGAIVFHEDNYIHHWWQKQGNNWILNILIKVRIQQVEIRDLGGGVISKSANNLPFYINANIYYRNERVINEIQSRKA